MPPAALGEPGGGVERDEELVARVAAADPVALAALYDRYGADVFGSLVRIVRDRSVAEELLQETFLRLWRHADGFEAGRGRLRPWLLAIAHHLALNELRRARRRPQCAGPRRGDSGETGAAEGGLSALREPGPGPPQLAWEAVRWAEVAEALRSLPPPQRVVIELYAVGYSQSEIAAQTGEPLGTVKTRMRRGLLRLRALLEMRGLEADASDHG